MLKVSNSALPKNIPLYCIFAREEGHSIENSDTVGSAFHRAHVENGQSF